jgi:hypothetical protein
MQLESKPPLLEPPTSLGKIKLLVIKFTYNERTVNKIGVAFMHFTL